MAEGKMRGIKEVEVGIEASPRRGSEVCRIMYWDSASGSGGNQKQGGERERERERKKRSWLVGTHYDDPRHRG